MPTQKEEVIEKNTAAEFGEAIHNMKLNSPPLIINEPDRVRILMFVRRKYSDSRLFTTRTVNNQLCLFRIV
jgi:hypothetical protein